MIDVSPSKWTLRHTMTYGDKTLRVPIKFPWYFRNQLIKVSFHCPNLKSHWYRAGYLRQFANGKDQLKSVLVPLNASTIFCFPTVSDYYTLLWSPVPWVPSGLLQVREYLDPLTEEDLQQFQL
jgi:hypothetical protein